ncbi:MAG: alpha/beta fold hydrolase [Candidatus Margulisbacteria bacterium]|nr:alpha/beta fold hydrolase [Candidatus Margulisiibacteriota bacterium]
MKKLIFFLTFLAALAAAGQAELNPVSLPYLMQKQFDGRDLKLIKVLAQNNAYTRYYVTYKSGGLTISGIINVPRGNGPFPVIITAHGYINPKVYTNGRGLKREQDYLARRGYVVFHPDYRNHAGSDRDPDEDLKLHLGYVEDVINAVYAVKNSGLKFFAKEKIGLLGHSLGGGIGLSIMVAKPDLVQAYVLFAPMSSDYRDNFNRWILHRREPKYGPRATALKIIERYGSPESNPEFWDNISAKTFLDNIKAPVEIHHGTADKSVPLAWSEKLVKELKTKGKAVKFYIYQGEPHEFINSWPLVMKRTVEFFNEAIL